MTGSVIYAVELLDAATSRLLSAFVSSNIRTPTTSKSVGPLAAAEAGLDKRPPMLAPGGAI